MLHFARRTLASEAVSASGQGRQQAAADGTGVKPVGSLAAGRPAIRGDDARREDVFPRRRRLATDEPAHALATARIAAAGLAAEDDAVLLLLDEDPLDDLDVRSLERKVIPIQPPQERHLLVGRNLQRAAEPEASQAA